MSCEASAAPSVAATTATHAAATTSTAADDSNYYGSLLMNISSNISKTISDTGVARRLSLCKIEDNEDDGEKSAQAPAPSSADSTTSNINSQPGLFARATSSNLWGYSNLFSGISSRLEAALQTSSSDLTAAGGGRPANAQRKPVVKNRAVYGQPQISLEKVLPTSRFRKELSRESLDTLDSGHSMSSSRASMNELLCSELHESGESGVFYRESAGSSVGIGSSLESSEAEEERSVLDGGSVGTCCSRSESRDSVRSVDSTASWSSSEDSQVQESNKQAKSFMQMFVGKIFDDGIDISAEEKAQFGEMSRTETGRLWFVRFINEQRAGCMQVQEKTFYSLVQYFAIVLFECADADDYKPAKNLMNMCLTYYYRPNGGQKYYLSQYLKDQPIWRSIRFWNAAYFEAVQSERVNNRQAPSGRRLQLQSRQEIDDEVTFQENVVFGQLGTFTYNLHEFGLSEQFSLEFLRKQVTIANLPKEQVELLQENITRLYESDKKK